MDKELFGTDGIRGKANQYPIIPEIMMQLGRSIVWLLKKNSDSVKIIIGKDTRVSGDMIEDAISSGICSMNGDAYLAGVLPTPGIAYLTLSGAFNAGDVVTHIFQKDVREFYGLEHLWQEAKEVKLDPSLA